MDLAEDTYPDEQYQSADTARSPHQSYNSPLCCATVLDVQE